MTKAPGTVAALLRALAKAEEIALQDNDRGRRQIVESLGESRKDEVSADWGEISFAVSLKQQLLMNLEEQGEWAARHGLANGSPPANYLRWLCLEPMQKAFPERMTVYN